MSVLQKYSSMCGATYPCRRIIEECPGKEETRQRVLLDKFFLVLLYLSIKARHIRQKGKWIFSPCRQLVKVHHHIIIPETLSFSTD